MKQISMRTHRLGAGQARVTVIHDGGIVDIIVAADGCDDPMSDQQVVEALRNAVKAMDVAGAHIEHHVSDHGY